MEQLKREAAEEAVAEEASRIINRMAARGRTEEEIAEETGLPLATVRKLHLQGDAH